MNWDMYNANLVAQGTRTHTHGSVTPSEEAVSMNTIFRSPKATNKYRKSLSAIGWE